MKRVLIIFVMLFTLFGLTSCKKKADVNIKALTATVEEAPTKLSANKSNDSGLIKLGAENNEDETDASNYKHAQYIVMYKSEKDIKFTIELDNPKGQAIDAVELRCDDVNATILVDESWEKLSSKDGYVINWASENAYKKTYYLQTISQESINTLTVSDIKINGKWQNAALDNNALKIYKMDDDTDLKWEFVTHLISHYEWRFVTSDAISNIQVKGAELTEDGTYVAKDSGTISYSWDYTVDGNTVSWESKKDIYVLKLLKNEDYNICYGKSTAYAAEGGLCLYYYFANGTTKAGSFNPYDEHCFTDLKARAVSIFVNDNVEVRYYLNPPSHIAPTTKCIYVFLVQKDSGERLPDDFIVESITVYLLDTIVLKIVNQKEVVFLQ